MSQHESLPLRPYDDAIVAKVEELQACAGLPPGRAARALHQRLTELSLLTAANDASPIAICGEPAPRKPSA